MEFLPNELRAKFDQMSPEEQAEFLKKREEAVNRADAGEKHFEVGSGGAMMDSSKMDEDELEAKKDQIRDNQQ